MQIETNPPLIKLEGEIMTNSQGVNKLMHFYHEALQFKNCEIILDCYQLQFLDANLTSLLSALTHRLYFHQKISFIADFNYLSKKFGVLFRNGWLQNETIQIPDYENTTIPCTCFRPDQSDEFVTYIKDKLMCHRGINLKKALRLRIENDLIEIYNNIYCHANTKDPFFVCGQYYPKLGYFIFSMVDLGVGFLAPIKKFTQHEISTDIDAIKWALNGNSTTGECLAGMGLKSIYDYCQNKMDGLQIYSGTAFWGTDLENTIWEGHRPLDFDFQGSMINLFFKFRQ